MPRKPTIAVVGAGQEIKPAVARAREVGRMIAENGWVLITGGRAAGVMKAASEGAKEAGGLTIGILPDGNVDIAAGVDVAIVTGTGEARNNIIVLSADVVVACGIDGAGTVSEVALAIKNQKPVILLGASPAAREFLTQIAAKSVEFAASPAEAIELSRARLLQ